MEFLKEKKKEIAEFCIAILIILEVILLLSPIFAHIKGRYYGESYNIRFARDTYEVQGRKGFYVFETISLPDNAGVSAVTLDTGNLFGKKSAFVMENYRSGETFVSGRAVFYQIFIVVAFLFCVYIAFIQRNMPIKKKAKDDDDDWDTSLLRN